MGNAKGKRKLDKQWKREGSRGRGEELVMLDGEGLFRLVWEAYQMVISVCI